MLPGHWWNYVRGVEVDELLTEPDEVVVATTDDVLGVLEFGAGGAGGDAEGDVGLQGLQVLLRVVDFYLEVAVVQVEVGGVLVGEGREAVDGGRGDLEGKRDR